MTNTLLSRLSDELFAAEQAGTYKLLKTITGPIGDKIELEGKGEVTLLSSNDYLGFANHPEIVEAARQALLDYGASTASVRFICGTQDIHQLLEADIAKFHGTEAALTYSSCWAANTGLFAAICGVGDVILSDELNHASLIDGIRATAKHVVRDVYKHSDMADLEAKLKAHADAPSRLIVTDGVFSMEGDIAPLDQIVSLAEKYDALIVLDDSHGLGVMGWTGHGTAEHFGVMDKIDIFTGTLGKALGAGTGGFVAGPTAVTETLIQRSRPHLFSNALPASVAAAGRKSLELLAQNPDRVTALQAKAAKFRALLNNLDLKPLPGDSAVVPVIVGETATAIRLAGELLNRGIFVTGFGFPIVPEGEARLRFQISAAHTEAELEEAAIALKDCLQSPGSP
ncbi:aminotransferase class I/II-fold pyridoxal phosphate-dependent enzyme [uncultured Sneathiella sp.]|jgi:glycine C-acetyltransferase|uniref:aminotransferase class I/II-fold pyridoxal phosphate-dependent enzyme n=1 Tax=uncultured Sneathiella sp. TaxID=879315 RepID=UPI0030D8DB0B|tara:strand:- start:4994 stop:6187 length:1194 start_codon:yes stop_codon:yes gene_type:complete